MKKKQDGYEIAKNAMRHRMLHYAFQDYQPGTWTFKKLQDIQMYNEEVSLQVDCIEEDGILSTSDETLPSPFLIYEEKIDGEESKYHLIKLSELALSCKQEIRKQVLSRIELFIEDEAISILEKTKKIIIDTRENLLRQEDKYWRPAALQLSAAFDNDVLVSFHGVRQSFLSSPVSKSGLNYYLPKLLFPEKSSLDSLLNNPIIPETHSELISEVISNLTEEASSIHELCESYFLKLGHLPLAPEFSLATTVNSWNLLHEGIDVWRDVWAWSEKQLNPTINYHACSIFILFPEYIPEDGSTILWEKIVEIVYDSSSIALQKPGSIRWKIHHDVLMNFVFLFESLYPDSKGAYICIAAWWLASKVSSLFMGIHEEDLLYFAEDWIKPLLDRSRNMWIIACSRIENSPIYEITHTVPSPWGLSALSIISGSVKFHCFLPTDQSNEFTKKFHDGLLSNLIALLPIPGKCPSERVNYAFEISLHDLIQVWNQGLIPENRKELTELIQASSSVDTSEKICTELKECSKSNSTNMDLVAIALKTKAYRNPEIAENIWTIISDRDWRSGFFDNAPNQVIDIVLNAFSVLQVKSGGDWLLYLPHYIAEQCEIEDSEKKLEKLFFYLVFLSYASDSVNAIQRLLRGGHKTKFITIVEKHRNSIEGNQRYYAPWIAGKMRAMLAGLYIE